PTKEPRCSAVSSMPYLLAMDLAPPGAGGTFALLDERLEAVEVDLDPPAHEPERVTEVLREALGVVLHAKRHPGPTVRCGREQHGTRIRRTRQAPPRDADVGRL